MSAELKCVQEFHKNGKLKREEFFNSDGERHNESGPAYRRWHENGQLAREEFYLNNKLHNEHCPAVRRWHENGQLWREVYWFNGNPHNESGPAYRRWDENGQLVCEEYWLDWHILPKAEWEAKVKPASCDGKVVEIEGRKYKLVAE